MMIFLKWLLTCLTEFKQVKINIELIDYQMKNLKP